jgi:L-2,4-diaminobutyrate transaminase
VNLGYNRPELIQAMHDQAGQLPYYHSFLAMSNAPAAELAEKITATTPGNLNKVFFGNSGSDANDTHVKIVWLYNNLLGRPNKKKFIARTNGYHGVTVASASLSGLGNLHAKFDVPLADRFLHTEKPHYYWNAKPGQSEVEYSKHCAAELEALIAKKGADTIAAFVAEPVMGAGGVIPPPEGYFDAIMPILKKHEILFLADEVVNGFGRLGTPTGSHYYGLEPDMMTLAKGLTCGYIQLSAAVVSDAIWEVLKEGTPQVGMFAHGYTYSAHPIAAAVGCAALDIYSQEKIYERAGKIGAYLHKQLDELVAPHPLVGQKRGVGHVAGVEVVADKANKVGFDISASAGPRIYASLMQKGVLLRPIKDTIAISPPHVISEAETDEMVEKLKLTLDEMLEVFTKEGLVK